MSIERLINYSHLLHVSIVISLMGAAVVGLQTRLEYQLAREVCPVPRMQCLRGINYTK
jgi:hypothetical protein